MNWEQLKTLVWLRWRLTRNQMTKGSALNAILRGIALVCGVLLLIGSILGGFVAGYNIFKHVAAGYLLLAADIFTGVFLFLWLLGLLQEIQRAEAIDFQRLMHLPISLRQLFTLNFVASLVTPSLILFLPGTVALALGATLGSGLKWLALIPLALGFFFLITAWTYCLRGWLVSLMVNPRRRRSIVTGITIAIVLLVQGPNLYFNVLRKGNSPLRSMRTTPERYDRLPEVNWAHRLLPPLWLAAGARELGNGNALPALGAGAGLWIFGWLGIRRAYRSTLRYYQAYEGTTPHPRPNLSGSSAPLSPSAPKSGVGKPARLGLLEWRLPWVSDDTAAMALASLRSMLRAPEMKMALLGPIIMLVVFAVLIGARTRSPIGDSFNVFIPSGLLTIMSFGLVQLLANQFGFDRNGFRSLALFPTPRRNLIVGRNLAYAPFVLGPGLILLALLPWLAGLTVLSSLCSLFQLLTMFCILCILGNILSIGLPFRINPGSLKPTKQPPKVILVLLIVHLFFPLLAIPIFLPPLAEMLAGTFSVGHGGLLNLALSILMCGLAVCGYAGSLTPLALWFEKREKEMLRVLTEVIE